LSKVGDRSIAVVAIDFSVRGDAQQTRSSLRGR
jgi:hypothetical protein